MDFMTLAMLAVLGVLVLFMFRNNKKRKAEQQELQTKLQPGVRIMTNFGLYGTLISINEDENIAVLETLSGAQLEVHRQTVARVIEPTEAPAVEAADADSSAPEFGERSADA